jgi:class 3 adenylate cyclase
MNPYALPSFIAFALLLVFSLAVILQNPRDKISRILCLLCLNLALTMGAVGMLHLSTNEAEANFWNKWPYILTLPSFTLMMAYAFQISGGFQRQKDKMLGLPIAIHQWILYSVLLTWGITIIFSDLVIAPAKYYSPTGWEHQYGSLFLTCLITGGAYALAYQIFILYRGIKSATNPIEKRARIIALVALGFLQSGIFIPGVILPFFFELQTHSFTALGFILMCFVIIYGFMRLQWDTIQDLNRGLEEKVALRTEELTLVNRRLQTAQEQISKFIDPKVAEKIFEGEISAQLSHRRTKLTMFFSDIQDFTKFTDSSDPEDVARLLNEYLGEMAQIVRKWGGTIPQFTGDSIYVIFGAPDSQGEQEDAMACVYMAVEMQARMTTLREKWWNQGIQFPFEIRCGIHTGMANVGNYGSEGFMEYSAIGLNTNLASRLEQVCKPGEIYLSHATWALVKDEIPCEEVGTIEVKGFHNAIQTYLVLQSDEKIEPVDGVP